jgi:cell division septum initiation protein DivIVA
MSNFEDDYDEDDYDQPASDQNPVRARMKQLEKEAKELRKQVAEFSVTQRELAFAKAGIDPASPQAKYFVKGYDGDLTPEAIRAAAEEAQLITPQPVQPDPDKAAWQQSNRIAAGAETTSDGPSWIKRIKDAESVDEISSIFAEAQAQGVNLG